MDGNEELPDDWTITANVVRETARKVLGMPSKQRKEDKDTCWWDEEVQESIRNKILAKKRGIYRGMKRVNKRGAERGFVGQEQGI